MNGAAADGANGADDDAGYRPRIFDLGDRSQRQAWDEWRHAHEADVHLHDTLHDQIAGLVKCRTPKATFTRHDLDEAIVRHGRGRPAEEVGVWVYYPWRRAAVRLLDEDDFVELRTSRNRYKITDDEQRLLRGKTIGIVGLSVGGQIAVTMAVERICGELRLADFDALELTNLNRLREGVFHLGMNKAVLAARSIAEIDPFLNVVCYEDGLTAANLDAFLTVGRRLDVLVEECDGLEMKVRCRLRARELGIPVVMEANDRGTLDIERFDRQPDRPILHGALAGHDLSRIGELRTNEDKVPIIMPMVGETTMSDKLRASLLEVGESLESWPQLASDVALGAGLVTNTVRRILLAQLHDSGRYFVDLDELVADGRPAGDAGGGTTAAPRAPMEVATPALDARGEPEQVALDPAARAALLAAAALAPSGGNEQPWRWVAHGPSLSVLVDRPFGDVLLAFRDLPRRLALGAAAENVVLRAHQLGMRVKVVPGDGEPGPAALTFKFFPSAARVPGLEPRTAEHDALATHIERRHTNRRVVPAAPLTADAAGALRRAVDGVPGCRLHLVWDAGELAAVADVVARAERLRMLHPVGHRDLVREVRWTPEEARATRDGIDLATLDLSASERAGMRLLREPGVARLLRQWKRGGALEKLARRAIVAASAVGLVTTAGGTVRDQLAAGRAIQRAWLTATALGLGVQPHTSALYLFARAFGGGQAAFDAEALEELAELKARAEAVFGLHPAPVFLFRVFPACEPGARALRRPVAVPR
jgi:molybdopterin/thiamine biosynthesis adenylyltransferase/nitroreductase